MNNFRNGSIEEKKQKQIWKKKQKNWKKTKIKKQQQQQHKKHFVKHFYNNTLILQYRFRFGFRNGRLIFVDGFCGLLSEKIAVKLKLAQTKNEK